jgi:Domain of Unknown Function (DUF1907)
MKAGKAKQHVMRDFSSTPINTDEEVNNWLKFYDMSAPLIAVGTLVSTDPVIYSTHKILFSLKFKFNPIFRDLICAFNTSTASVITGKLDTIILTLSLKMLIMWPI